MKRPVFSPGSKRGNLLEVAGTRRSLPKLPCLIKVPGYNEELPGAKRHN